MARAAVLLMSGLALGLAGPTAWADGTLTVTGAWARATPPNARSDAVYLRVVDSGAPDQLVGVSTPVAATASLHESRMVGGVMQMRAVIGLGVAAGRDLVLAPGGFHIMLTGLAEPLRAGQTFPISLRFRDNGLLTATVRVEPIGAAGPSTSKPGAMPGINMNQMDMNQMNMNQSGGAAAPR